MSSIEKSNIGSHGKFIFVIFPFLHCHEFKLECKTEERKKKITCAVFSFCFMTQRESSFKHV